MARAWKKSISRANIHWTSLKIILTSSLFLVFSYCVLIDSYFIDMIRTQILFLPSLPHIYTLFLGNIWDFKSNPSGVSSSSMMMETPNYITLPQINIYGLEQKKCLHGDSGKWSKAGRFWKEVKTWKKAWVNSLVLQTWPACRLWL